MAGVAGTHGQHVAKVSKLSNITSSTHGGHYALNCRSYIQIALDTNKNKVIRLANPVKSRSCMAQRHLSSAYFLDVHVGPRGVHVGPHGFNKQPAWLASLEDSTMENLRSLTAAVV